MQPDLAIAEQVLGALQQHRNRDRVELVVDLGLEWDTVEPTVDSLVRDGFITKSLSDGEPIFALAVGTTPLLAKLSSD